jgi:hypothetical protein
MKYATSCSCQTLCVILAERKRNEKLINMKKLKLAYFLLVASTILLILNIYNLDFNNLQNGNYWGIVSNLLLMFGMIVNIRDLKKNEENK